MQCKFNSFSKFFLQLALKIFFRFFQGRKLKQFFFFEKGIEKIKFLIKKTDINKNNKKLNEERNIISNNSVIFRN